MESLSTAEQLFFTTVKIQTEGYHGESGAGTGFFFRAEDPSESLFFIVTNKHVIEKTKTGKLHIQKAANGKPLIGAGVEVEFDEQSWQKMWIGHPDPNVDIAICALAPIVNQLKFKYDFSACCKMVSYKSIPTDEQIKTIPAIEEITFVGYPNGLWDKVSKLPVARKGHIATPFDIDYEGEAKFLIDASVFGGSSGSPVFIYNVGPYSTRDGAVHMGARLFFVGIVAAVYYRTDYNKVIALPIPTQMNQVAEQKEMIDLGVVFKARTVLETIEYYMNTITPDRGNISFRIL